MVVDISSLTIPQRQDYLQHAIAPRPICLASSVDKEGNINLSPFSFFNLFSVNPPIAIFSPSRRVRDNTTKHTLENILEVPEVVINIVDFDMVQQTSLSSCEYAKSVNEFEKAGFTPVPPTIVRPPMVKESKVKMECRVVEVKILGNEAGAGNLVFCEILRMHIDDSILDENGRIDQKKLHHVARLGGDWYAVVNPGNLFLVPKPNRSLGIGVDGLPDHIRNSRILTGNNLGELANVESIPDIDPAFEDEKLKNIFQYYSVDPGEMEKELHLYARHLLEKGRLKEAWQVLLSL
ncbi:MAG TPA: flavin reductase family protein [Puia sp.]|nr:flavin reductase family protein [Puia sp.]